MYAEEREPLNKPRHATAKVDPTQPQLIAHLRELLHLANPRVKIRGIAFFATELCPQRTTGLAGLTRSMTRFERNALMAFGGNCFRAEG